MIERIKLQEERFDQVSLSVKKLQTALLSFQENQKNLKLINKYYGSKNWFKDKETYEKKLISPIKAGILSEDAVWNINEEVIEIVQEMKALIKLLESKK